MQEKIVATSWAKVKLQILKREYEVIEQFCRTNFEISKEDEKDFIATMLFFFANEELEEEKGGRDTFDFKKVVTDFWEVQYEINKTERNAYTIVAKVPIKTFTNLLNNERELYPEIGKCDGKIRQTFIGYLAFLLIQSIKGGNLSPKFVFDKKWGIKQHEKTDNN
ncbi:hypothetical protein [Lactobacillus bombicola]|uniref:Uncharacterized protein n=1 Tax=Lactobacillus bombicola TaxID=1505723 RepID=A0A396T752_9LACO|nr:hypothetical protein [Lactobacillus bombicola]RHW49243.1 hypothetical protein DS834_07880 [Lactobacillus bombicola]RHW55083.1 hypothetical protein DS835_01530 [Lactobacillus bombicola]